MPVKRERAAQAETTRQTLLQTARRLFAQQVNAEVERVKNGRARTTVGKRGNRPGRCVRIGGEVPFEARLAIKTDHRNAMWHIADHRIQHRLHTRRPNQGMCLNMRSVFEKHRVVRGPLYHFIKLNIRK